LHYVQCGAPPFIALQDGDLSRAATGANGQVSKAEREHINKMQYEAARNIQRDKQNGRSTNGY
jgi:hypothetical protein